MSKKDSNKKGKRNYSRTIDLVFLLILMIIMVMAFYIAFTFGILPQKWILIAAAVFAVIFAILFILSLKKLPKWAVYTKRVFILLLCALLGTGGYFLDKTRSTLRKVSSSSVSSESNVEKLMVIVPKDSNISSIHDLENATIGFQNSTDKDNAEYVKQQLSGKVTNYTAVDALDYTQLITDMLDLKTVQALAISETYYNMSAANIDAFKDNVKTIETYETTKKTKPTTRNIDITKDTFTVYLSGIDNMGSPDQQTRTDTNLILIVNPVAKHIDMVSLPRDGYIPNPAMNYMNDKLTHTGNDGIENSVAAIENFFQIPIDYYARIGFNSLIQIIDAIGGIDVDVEIDFSEQDENRSFKEEDMIHLKKGKQHLNGKQALAYARHRKTEGYDNAGRERAQQRIIKAMINKMISPSAIGYLNKLLDIIPNYVITNMPSDKITDFVSNELNDLSPWTISSIKSDTGCYDDQVAASTSTLGISDCYLFSRDEVHALLNAFEGASNQLKMNEFHFDLQDLYKDTPQINQDQTLVWSDMAIRPH